MAMGALFFPIKCNVRCSEGCQISRVSHPCGGLGGPTHTELQQTRLLSFSLPFQLPKNANIQSMYVTINGKKMRLIDRCVLQ
jgi:hypothetical protein